MDILISLADGSIVNVEMQKIGYAFPAERSECYASDITMRQYSVAKNQHGKKFSFRDLKPIYINLDIFMKSSHNITNDMEAWLTFLASDQPADILKLIQYDTIFAEIYQDMAEYRRDVKGLMGLYSESLKILDHNTELYMIDELQNKLRQKDSVIAERDNIIAEKDTLIAELRKQLEQQK